MINEKVRQAYTNLGRELVYRTLEDYRKAKNSYEIDRLDYFTNSDTFDLYCAVDLLDKQAVLTEIKHIKEIKKDA